MADQTGPAVAAVQAGEEALLARYREAAAGDRTLTGVLADVHAGAVAARNRLDAIAAEIDAGAQNHAAFAVDTPLGAREFQKLLIVKHRELIALVDEASRDAAANRELLTTLQQRYSG